MDAAQAHELSEILEQIRLNVVHDGELSAVSLLRVAEPVIYDVGANRGQSIVSFKSMLPDARIDAFELNPLFHPVLGEVSSRYTNVRIHHYGLSDMEGPVDFYIPIVRGRLLYEEASIDNVALDRPWVRDRLTSLDPDFQVVKHAGGVRVGDSLELPPPDLIKIDVEGVELKVVLGFMKTIEAHRPIVIVENSDWQAVTDLLGGHGYKAHRYEPSTRSLIDFHGQTTNTYYILEGHDRGLLSSHQEAAHRRG